MTLSMRPNPLVKKKSSNTNASFNSKCTHGTITTNTTADNDKESTPGITLTKSISSIVSETKSKVVGADALNHSVATNASTTASPSPPPPIHGYPPHPGYPGMMPMPPGMGMGMHPMYMMPPMPMGCYSYNCGPYPQPPYGCGDGASSRGSTSRRSGGWCYGGHPDITEIDVEDGVSFDSRDSCATLMCIEPLEKTSQMITKVLDSWANNVNNAMDYGENLCHPIDTKQPDNGAGLSDTLMNVIKGDAEGSKEAAVSEIEKTNDVVVVEDEAGLEKTAQTSEEAVKVVEDTATVEDNQTTEVMVDNKTKDVPFDEVKGNQEHINDTDKVKRGVGFFQRMKNLNPLKTLDMSAISKDSEVNDLNGDADVNNVVITETREVESNAATNHLDTNTTDIACEEKNYFLNEISFEFSPEGVTIQPEAAPSIDTPPTKAVDSNTVDSQPPIVASAISNAKTKRPEKKMMKFPRVNSRYAKLGGAREVVEEQIPFDATFPTDVALDSNGFPILSQHNNTNSSSTWECAFGNSNPFANSASSPVSVAAVLEMRSCAWCGKGGTDAAAARDLKLCSACQTTYYCSAECQSKDWIDGHSKTCQPI